MTVTFKLYCTFIGTNDIAELFIGSQLLFTPDEPLPLVDLKKLQRIITTNNTMYSNIHYVKAGNSAVWCTPNPIYTIYL